jgi:tellurite resistance protein
MENGPSRDVYISLAAIGWADGALAPEEAEGILAAARDAGLSVEDIAEIERATKERRPLESLNLEKLSKLERTFIYATAIWLVRLDGKVEVGERLALKSFGDLLGLPDVVRMDASAAAKEIAELPSGDRPARYDFNRLRSCLVERLKKHEGA